MVPEHDGAGRVIGGLEVTGCLLELPSMVAAEACFGLDCPFPLKSGGTESGGALLPFDRMRIGGELLLPLRRIHGDDLYC